jgi:MFS family permease
MISSEFKNGWPVVAAAAIGIGLGLSPLPFYTIDVMVKPLGDEFGWSRGDVYGALAIYTFAVLAMAPLIGFLAEKYGARRVALVSIFTFSLSMMALALNDGSKPVYFALWTLLAVAGAGTLPITFTRPINTWFDKSRGFALGLALIATGVFGALTKSYAQYMVDWIGWRGAYVALGALPLLIALPIGVLTLRDVGDTPARDAPIVKMKAALLAIPMIGVGALIYFALKFVGPQIELHGMRLEYVMALVFMTLIAAPVALMLFGNIKTAPDVSATTDAKAELPGLTLPQALRTWRFWLLAIVFIPISYALGAIIPSLVPLLMSKGFDTAQAVSLATLTGLAVLLGRLVGGLLIDRFWAPAVAFIFLASPALALFMLAGDVTADVATIAILMIGFGAGVEYDFMAYLVSKYFGMKRYSAVYGALYGFFAAGAGFGPTIMNNLADSQGWTATLHQGAILLFVSTLPLLLLGRYRNFDAPTTSPPAAALAKAA